MGKQFTEEKSRLAAFSAKDESQLQEGTSTYYRFENIDDKLDALFQGTEMRNLDANNPEKVTECAILVNEEGEKFIMAQTIVVKELKKKWDELGEIGFPCRIIYKGVKGTGSDQYQSFRILFE